MNGTNKKAMGGFGAVLGGALKISYRHSSAPSPTILHPNLLRHTAPGSNALYFSALTPLNYNTHCIKVLHVALKPMHDH